MKKIFIFMLALGSIMACNSQTKEKTQREVIQKMDVATFKKGIESENAQVIDVRTPSEYEQGYIGEATLIDFLAPDFKEKAQKLDKNKPVYLYCRSGGRSGRASKVLKGLGFTEINDLNGGYSAWQRQ